MSEPFPRLRGVEFFPVSMGAEETRIAVRDPLAYMEQILVLSPLACFIAAHLDGKNGIEDIQASFARQFEKRILPSDTILQVIQTLAENFLLEDERFERRAREVEREFRDAPVRAAAHAEGGYAAEPAALELQLGGYFRHADGPGGAEPPSAEGELAGVVSPHIDFHRGGPAYAWAYREALGRKLADLHVILGVAHVSPPSPFVLTRKDYATPHGPASTDAALAERVAKALDWDPFEFEITHRKEHSIEFQAVFLRYCASARGEKLKILPVLVASAPEDPRTGSFLEALAKELKAYPGKVCVVAGVDLSHMGRRFGDDFDMTPERLSAMERGDREGLESVLALDAEGWRERTAPGGKNERKVCGFGALYAFCRLMKELHPGSAGKLLRYGHAPDPSGGEVSFASLSFLR